MTRTDREHLQKRIVQHYITVANRKKSITVNHFLEEKVPRQNFIASLRSMKSPVISVINSDLIVQGNYQVDT